jgi:carbon storage regulator
MLVLARRLYERIILPSLDTTIQVVGIQGNLVRLGIEAPPAVPIFREEVYDPARVVAGRADAQSPTAVRYNIRNRMTSLSLSIALLHRQLPVEFPADARHTLEQIDAHFAALKAQVLALLQENTTHDREAQLTS